MVKRSGFCYLLQISLGEVDRLNIPKEAEVKQLTLTPTTQGVSP
jgi:hypothetical protein